MRLLFFLLVVLCVSSVLPNSIEGNAAEDSEVDGSVKEEKVCIICVTVLSAEEEEPNPSETSGIEPDARTSNFERRQRWKKKWLHRRQKNRFVDHHHHHHHHHHHERWSAKAKRFEERKNRLASDKERSGTKIQYLERSSRTNQQNDAVDKMLALFSQTLNNETFQLKLDKPNAEMKIVPWTFVQFDNATSSEKRITDESLNNNKLEAPEAETDSDVEDNEDANTEDDSKVTTNMEDESSAEVKTTKEEVMKTTDEDDDDDDEEEDAVSETPADFNCLENSKPFQLVSNAFPTVLSDGATEYYVKLLSQQEIHCRNGSRTEPFTELQEGDAQERRMTRKHKRAQGRRRSRKTFSKVVGVELLERSADVMIVAKENSSARVVDVQLQIGPLTFVMDRKAAYPFENSRVAFPALMARLRLKVWDGQLVSAKFKPKKIQPSKAVVILQLKEGDELPRNQDVVARVVGYLSQETTNAWNTGYLLRRIKRQFKYIYIGKMGHKKVDFTNEDARKLVKLLLESISIEKQPSTENPVTDAPTLNLKNVEALSALSTSRPLFQ